MAIPVINPTDIVIGAVFPPTALDKNTLTRVYSNIVRRYSSYGSFSFLSPGGAKISQDGVSDVIIQQDKLQFVEHIEALAFQHVKEKSIEIFRIVLDQVKPQIFMVLGVKLISLIEFSEENGAVKFINANMLTSLKQEHLNILDLQLLGTGLRFHWLKEDPSKSQYDLKIEPFFRNRKNLYVELDVQFTEPVTNIFDILEKRIALAADYMKNTVKDFLNEF